MILQDGREQKRRGVLRGVEGKSRFLGCGRNDERRLRADVGAAFEAVVEIAVADGSEGEVIDEVVADGLGELLLKIVEGEEMVRGGGELEARGLEEFLEAAVQEYGHLSGQEDAGVMDDEDGVFGAGGEDGGAAVFFDEDLSGGVGGFEDVEGVGAEPVEGLVVSNRRGLFACHG
jgi:hypothetical protein